MPEEGELEGQEDGSGGGREGDGEDALPFPPVRGPPRSRQRKLQGPQQHPARTLFVGDLPPMGFSSTDLADLFGAFGWQVVSARVMGSQCYGFVEFGTELEAEQALQLVQDRDPGFAINGCSIRASRAKGSMPGWKQGKAVVSRLERGQGLEGLEAYEHPTARLVRLQQATAAASALAADAAAAVVPLPAAVLPGVVVAAARPVVDYGDL